MPEKFQSWFDKNSGYALHKTAKRKFSVDLCCEKEPETTGKNILFPGFSGRMEPFDLYRFSICKRYYVKQGAHYCLVDNLLKYQIL